MGDDDYIGLVETAQDALRAVLKQTEPGTGMTLHYAYRELKRTVDKYDQAQRKCERDEWFEEYDRARAVWKAISTRERERLVFEHLGDERLTIRELFERVTTALPDCQLHEPEIRQLVNRLYKARDLDRKGEPFAKTRIRFRYFRRPLDGPIADLERAFHNSDGAEGKAA